MNARLVWSGGLAAAVLSTACSTEPLRLHDVHGEATTEFAVISLPEELEVASVNGVEIEGANGLWSKGDKTLEVAPGRYELLAYYREIWQRGDHHDVLRSDPARFYIEAQAGGRYRIDYPRPANFEAAQRLAAEFAGWTEDLASGERSDSLPSGLGFRRGLIASATGDDTLVPVAGRAGRHQPVAPLPDSPDVLRDEASATHSAPPMAPARESEWLLLMQGWWSQASAAERREFLRWLSTQR
jgi:uncharacterized protein YccT (UPF0319 family)